MNTVVGYQLSIKKNNDHKFIGLINKNIDTRLHTEAISEEEGDRILIPTELKNLIRIP